MLPKKLSSCFLDLCNVRGHYKHVGQKCLIIRIYMDKNNNTLLYFGVMSLRFHLGEFRYGDQHL
jgi:hypothetical protein